VLKFENYPYERPKMAEINDQFDGLLKNFVNASSMEAAKAALQEINRLRSRLSTLENLVYIRSTVDVSDPFYQKEREFFDAVMPEFEERVTRFYRALADSAYRKELEKEFGSQLFKLAEYKIKSFSEEVIPLLQEENKLTTEYEKLGASAQIKFRGKTWTLSQLDFFLQDPDRDTRKEAAALKYGFFADHAETYNEIFDKLVKLRNERAVKLGYKNFVELGYLLMNRIDYDARMVGAFRKQVREHIVPVAAEIYKRQRERIGVDALKFYDESFYFRSGNAKPKGPTEWMVENGKTMYRGLAKETEEFFQFMLDRNLMDLESKPNKAPGGYCTYLEDYQSPFIFANFNGTAGDVNVLTHEFGHAFQVYCSRDFSVPEYFHPTHESAEISSMSMEFFTWPWMHLFFGEDALKYQYSHLTDALTFIPYGAAVDEFQHLVYANPDWTPQERNQAWRQLEHIYLPHRDYDGNEYLEGGGYWHRQLHIFEDPFYYIDYTLAQICAFQFWKRDREDHEGAWQDYVRLCRLGGSRSFLNLAKAANLRSPFEKGTVSSVIAPIKEWLEQVDDKAL